MKNSWLYTIVSIVTLLLSIPFYYSLIVEINQGLTIFDTTLVARLAITFASINVILSILVLLKGIREKRAVLYVQILGIISLILSLNSIYNSTISYS